MFTPIVSMTKLTLHNSHFCCYKSVFFDNFYGLNTEHYFQVKSVK